MTDDDRCGPCDCVQNDCIVADIVDGKATHEWMQKPVSLSRSFGESFTICEKCPDFFGCLRNLLCQWSIR